MNRYWKRSEISLLQDHISLSAGVQDIDSAETKYLRRMIERLKRKKGKTPEDFAKLSAVQRELEASITRDENKAWKKGELEEARAELEGKLNKAKENERYDQARELSIILEAIECGDLGPYADWKVPVSLRALLCQRAMRFVRSRTTLTIGWYIQSG